MITITPADLALDFTGMDEDIAAAWHEFVQGRGAGASPTHWARFQVLPAWALALFAGAEDEVKALHVERALVERHLFAGVFDTGPMPAGDWAHNRLVEIATLLRPLDLPTHDERVAETVGCTVAEAERARLYRRGLAQARGR